MKNFNLVLFATLALLLARPAAALVTTANPSGTTIIAGAAPISLTYTSAPLGMVTGVLPNGFCAQVNAGFIGGGVFNNPGAVCSGTFSDMVQPALNITTSPQVEALNYIDDNLADMLAIVGHGGRAWIVRSLLDNALTTAQAVVVPVRVYRSTAESITVMGEAATVNGVAGGVVPVRSNDSIGGFAANIFNTTYSLVSAPGLTGVTMNNSTGTIVIPANQTMGGAIAITYNVCQAVTQLANCVTGVANVNVTGVIPPVPPVVVIAGADSASFSSDGGSINILANDTVDGAPAASVPISVTLLNNGGLAGASIDGQNRFIVPVQTMGGVFVAFYQICERTQGACGFANITVTIIRPPIVAVNDVAALQTTGGRVDVLVNDRFNNLPASPANVSLAITNTGGLTGLSVSGADIVIPSAAPVGNTTISYQICERPGSANCASATLTLTITALPAVAVADAATIMSTGGTVNILANDLINGSTASAANASVSITNNAGLTALSLNQLAEIVVPANTTPGRYTIGYQLCERATTNCVSTTLNLLVLGNIVATDDSATLTTTGGAVAILLNDAVNQQAVNLAATDITLLSNGGLNVSLNQGQLIVANNIAAGSYMLRYQLCQRMTTNCATANVTITIQFPIMAGLSSVTLTGSGGVVNILDGATINGAAATASNIGITLTNNGGATGANLNQQLQLVVPAGLINNTYVIGYQLCQRGTTNCVTGSISVRINVAALRFGFSNARAALPPAGGMLNLLASLTIDGRSATITDVILTLISNANIANLVINSAGGLVVPAGLQGGAYQPKYRICQRQLPSNCSEATAFITITQSVTSVVSNRPPSVPGGGIQNTRVTIIGQSGAPITFNTLGNTSNVAGAVTDPLTFSNVKLVFGDNETGNVQAFYAADATFSNFGAQLNYSGSGVLRGRWEVVYPGDPLPTELDLFPEAGLPVSLRREQQRFFQLDRVQQFLSPIGRYFLTGPDPAKLPRNIPGQYLILLRVEATTGAGGVEGGGAAFAFPVLSYTVFQSDGLASSSKQRLQAKGANAAEFSSLGSIPRGAITLDSASLRPTAPGQGILGLGPKPITLMLPQTGARIPSDKSLDFSWVDLAANAGVKEYRFELTTASDKPLIIATIKPGESRYTAPPIVRDDVAANTLVRWRVVGLNEAGKVIAASQWRGVGLGGER
jgi:hypothetical protein